MKIIKDGDESKRVEKVVEFVCENCGCSFLAGENEYSLEKRYLRGSGIELEDTIATTFCPNCTMSCEKEIFSKLR